jgi:hypothetical protein
MGDRRSAKSSGEARSIGKRSRRSDPMSFSGQHGRNSRYYAEVLLGIKPSGAAALEGALKSIGDIRRRL